MHNKAVVSSNIEHVGYHLGVLYIRFHSGVTYSYPEVPFEVYQKLADAESVGQYFHQHIKGKFDHVRLADDPLQPHRQTEKQAA